jgi:hypothetical protein
MRITRINSADRLGNQGTAFRLGVGTVLDRARNAICLAATLSVKAATL